ncbi:MAG: glycine betaine ABC transporter substrate-binding protein [Synechococcales cyanobacterium]
MAILSRRQVLSGLALAAGAASAPFLGRHSASAATVIRVGSKDFTEQFILGEMYALLLENAGLQVERKLNLGGTPVAQAAITSGEIDLYPEYTGTGLLTVLKLPVQTDPKVVFEQVAKGYADQFKLVWLDPAPMNNTQALVMTQEGSQKFGVKTFSQMAAKASELIMIGPPEFQARPDGLPGLQKAYGNFRLKGYRAVDPGLRYTGLTSGQADVAVAFGTDGQISHYNLVLLEDDKKLFPPYQVAPVVRQDTLTANPVVGETLNKLTPLLTDATMQRLNFEVDGNQREPAEVAYRFLVESKMLG